MEVLKKSSGEIITLQGKPIKMPSPILYTVNNNNNITIEYFDENDQFCSTTSTVSIRPQIIKVTTPRSTEPNVDGNIEYMEDHGPTIAFYKVNGNCSLSYVECCFVKDTLITMENNTYKPIQEIKIGDKVLSYSNEKYYITEVVNILKNNNSKFIAKIFFDNNSYLEMTDYHPILTTSGWHSLTRYKGYDILKIGDNCITENGLSKIINIERYETDPFTTYNLDVKDFDEIIDNDINDNFFANGICVHNATC